MWKIATLAVACLFLGMGHASAQSNVIINCQIGTSATGLPIYAPASATNPCPVGSASRILTPLGQQTITSATLAAAQTLTIPTGATIADFFPEGTGGTNNQCVRYRDDGTAPTATVGTGLAPQQLLLGYSTQTSGGTALASFSVILATGATCTLTINYYK